MIESILEKKRDLTRMDNLFYNHLGKLIIAGILILVISTVAWFNWMNSESNKKDKEQQLWIDNCVKSGGRVETVGAWYTSMHYICYPK